MKYKSAVFTDDLLTGNPTIDAQHKSLFDQMDRILDSVLTGKSHDEIYRLIRFLEDYTTSHFQAEEALMEKHGYTGISYHQAQHERFVRELKKNKEYLGNDGPDLKQISAILSSLQAWLINHVMQEDKEFARAIKKQP